ncbi:MAG: hypothetical protein QOD11_88 [Bradyrhizobium sp.]|jgi:hypothetical protein|nr:hypothetical protein [Bradyrhizobium sp.]
MKQLFRIALLCAGISTTAFAADEKTIFDKWSAAGFTLKQSMTSLTKPASFSYEQTERESFFASQFALIYTSPTPKAIGNDIFFPQFAIEGDLGGTKDDKKNNFLRAYGSIVQLHSLNPATVNGFYQRFGPVYEGTKDFSIQNAYAEYEFVPVYQPLGVGVFKPLVRGIDYQLNPGFLLDTGANIRRTSTAFEQNDTLLRVIPYMNFALSFSDLSKVLGIHATILTVGEKVSYLPLEQIKFSNAISTALDFAFTEHAHLVFSYSRGREAPKFTDVPDLAVKFGLSFGKGVLE